MYAVVVYGVMSHKPPCPGKNSITDNDENYYSSDEDDKDLGPPPRLKRHVTVPGNCYYCGVRTSESAVQWTLYCCYDCADNN
jgi:hypothetical protein